MLSANDLIQRMKKRLPPPVFKAVDTDFFIDILMSETLSLYSQYFPKLVEGIVINTGMSIEIVDSTGFMNSSTKYAVPMLDDDWPYTGVAVFNYFRNFDTGGTYSNPGAVDAFASRIMGSMNAPAIRYTPSFEGPNIIEISPPPRVHIDYTVSMYKLRKLSEVKNGYAEIFKRLFEADVKIALYYKFYTLTEGGSFGGIELKDYVGSFLDYESKRDDIIEEFEKTYWKDPDRHAEMFSVSQMVD